MYLITHLLPPLTVCSSSPERKLPHPFGIIGTVTAAGRESERLTALGGLAALSLDALSSVAYGPEAILVVLVAAGTAGLRFSLPVTGATVVLLVALVISYRQVIEAFPNGGGAYAVSQRHLGRVPSLVAAASLIIDYVLNAAVGVSAGVEALPRPRRIPADSGRNTRAAPRRHRHRWQDRRGGFPRGARAVTW